MKKIKSGFFLIFLSVLFLSFTNITIAAVHPVPLYTNSPDKNGVDSCGGCSGDTTCDGAGTCSCPAGQSRCSNSCVNEQTDSSNCGSCGNTCTGGKVCSSGTCQCPGGQTSCSGSCVDITSSSANCGSCGNTCVWGTTCSSGTCM